jgi:C1A family cysteine protease
MDINWVTQGKVGPVKNQGSCDAGWAFAAIASIESFLRMKGTNINLSEQQLIDCSRPQGNQGCIGGWPSSGLFYVKGNGITTQAAYPYVGRDQSCKTQGGSFKISGFTSYSGCNGLTAGLMTKPLAVSVDATNWSPYRSGVFNNCARNINHHVLAVGIVNGNWKLKNNWGIGWGEAGYINLSTGNTCGICNYAGVSPN